MWQSISGAPDQVVLYPVLEAHLTHVANGKVKEWTVPSCCFHDLLSATDGELAGMGLAILGNLIKLLGKDLYDQALWAHLWFKRYQGDPGIECPWPGMADNSPLPLNLTDMPFDSSMFLDDDQFKRRVDRLTLMARIEEVWVPWLKQQLVVAGVA